MREEGQRWCILRTAGRHTLGLAASLAGDGYDVWTPAREVRVRRARWNVHREVRVPLLASFVFARADHLVDLLERAEMPGTGFSVFHYFDRIPLVADQDLAPLRDEETAAPSQAELAGLFRKGEGVRVAQGIFGGMAGIVEEQKGEFTLVRFGSRMRVKISTFILQPTSVISRSQAKAA
jgi:transcription antitermination factor NusG